MCALRKIRFSWNSWESGLVLLGIGRFLVSLRKKSSLTYASRWLDVGNWKVSSQFTKRSKQYLSQARSGLIARERNFSAEVHNYVIFPPLNAQAKNLTVHPSENETRKQIRFECFSRIKTTKICFQGEGDFTTRPQCAAKASISHNTPEVQLEPILMDIMFPPLEGSV